MRGPAMPAPCACSASAPFAAPPTAFRTKHTPRQAHSLRCRLSSDDSGPSSSSSVPDRLPAIGVDTDWRAFRARLVAAEAETSPVALSADDEHWAHTLPRPEAGCLLLAHPLMFTSNQAYFFHSVIFLFSHDDSGSAGVIINRPTQYKVEQAAGTDALQPEFADCPLYLGGDVGRDTVHLLHGVPGLPEAVEVVRGVYLGGFAAAKAGLAAGRLAPGQFKVLTRYAGWGPGQLEEECSRGVWFPVAASKSAILQHVQHGGASELWHAIMQLVGGEYAQLSDAVNETYRADIMELDGGAGGGKSGGAGNGADDGAAGGGAQAPRRRPGDAAMQGDGEGI